MMLAAIKQLNLPLSEAFLWWIRGRLSHSSHTTTGWTMASFAYLLAS